MKNHTHYFKMNTKKKILYIDMDNTIVDFQSGIDFMQQMPDTGMTTTSYDEIPGIFYIMKPRPGAVEIVKALTNFFDVYILTTAPWNNPSAWVDKLCWIKQYFGPELKKKLIITHHKDLLIGDYLIDDSPKNGAANFHGEWLHFLEEERDQNGYGKIDWKQTLDYLFEKENIKKC